MQRLMCFLGLHRWKNHHPFRTCHRCGKMEIFAAGDWFPWGG